MQNILHKLGLLDYAVHELQALVLHVVVGQDRPEEVLDAALGGGYKLSVSWKGGWSTSSIWLTW